MRRKEKILTWISDLYKDVYGCRPRTHCFEQWSTKELNDFVDQLEKLLKEQQEEEKLQEERDVIEFKEELDKFMELAPDRKTALQWLLQPKISEDQEEIYQDDIEGFLWSEGILFTDYGKQILVEYNKIYNIY
jgi:protein subunit release factor A